ncbi:hypothetical protein, partial [Plesiomonas shigelloides]|uniref:hypothetical protein n=1 Tax=Plesiomonas shigelloides TaxID=703 RepID=UPI001403E0C4
GHRALSEHKTLSVSWSHYLIAQQMRVNNNKQGISYHDEVINSLQQCEKSLYVLKELKSKKYQQMLSQYNKTASKVKLYSSVRDSLPKENLDSIGSILLISVQSTCNQIAAAAEQGVLSKISM